MFARFQPFLNSILLDSIFCLFSRSSMFIASAIIYFICRSNSGRFLALASVSFVAERFTKKINQLFRNDYQEPPP